MSWAGYAMQNFTSFEYNDDLITHKHIITPLVCMGITLI